MDTPRKLAAGNWKMNGLATELGEVAALAARGQQACEVLICPPATLLTRMADVASGTIALGGQDCHAANGGAHTGDISAPMMRDAGATFVIVGHSERRTDHGERDEAVRDKALAVWSAELCAVICIGETLAEREAGDALTIVERQIAGSVPDGATAANCVIAYEPVWAIGTGKVPTLDEIAAVHSHIRGLLAARFGDEAHGMRILYGGSVKPSNAAEIFSVADVDGALVGGASLKAVDFGAIIDALSAS
ncbi:MAG: triose-phosphate isomerase [Pseudomonadota bacterium]